MLSDMIIMDMEEFWMGAVKDEVAHKAKCELNIRRENNTSIIDFRDVARVFIGR